MKLSPHEAILLLANAADLVRILTRAAQASSESMPADWAQSVQEFNAAVDAWKKAAGELPLETLG